MAELIKNLSWSHTHVALVGFLMVSVTWLSFYNVTPFLIVMEESNVLGIQVITKDRCLLSNCDWKTLFKKDRCFSVRNDYFSRKQLYTWNISKMIILWAKNNCYNMWIQLVATYCIIKTYASIHCVLIYSLHGVDDIMHLVDF